MPASPLKGRKPHEEAAPSPVLPPTPASKPGPCPQVGSDQQKQVLGLQGSPKHGFPVASLEFQTWGLADQACGSLNRRSCWELARALSSRVLVLWAGLGTDADFLDCGGEMGEAVEHVLSEGGDGAAASQMMSSQAEELDR